MVLTWSKNCVITSKATRDANPDADPAVVAVNNPTNATFKIADAKLYVPVVNFCHLKMKMRERLFQSIIHQALREKTSMYELTAKVFLMFQ